MNFKKTGLSKSPIRDHCFLTQNINLNVLISFIWCNIIFVTGFEMEIS